MEPFAITFVPIEHAKNVGAQNMTVKRTKSQVDQQIDENLKRVYDDVLNEAVPDKFLDLIAQLKGAEAAPKSDPNPDPKDSNDA